MLHLFFSCEGVNWHRLREVPEGMAAKHAGFGFSMWCSTGKDQRLHFEKKKKNPSENSNSIAVRMMSVHTLIYNRLLSEI